MTDLLILITYKDLYTFLLENEKYSLVKLMGESTFSYNHNRVSESITKYIDTLKNEFGYENTSNFTFSATFVDEISKAAICEKINQITRKPVKEADLDKLAVKILQKLSENPELCIEEYGINVGKFSYKVKPNDKSKAVKNPFSLTAHTVPYDAIGEIIS